MMRYNSNREHEMALGVAQAVAYADYKQKLENSDGKPVSPRVALVSFEDAYLNALEELSGKYPDQD